MIYLTVENILRLHQHVIKQSGGDAGLLKYAALESAVAQPQMTFGGQELYPDLVSKASALGFFIISNHAFVDGNKRTGLMAMELFLLKNGKEIEADIDAYERIILRIASGQMNREQFEVWVRKHIVDST